MDTGRIKTGSMAYPEERINERFEKTDRLKTDGRTGTKSDIGNYDGKMDGVGKESRFCKDCRDFWN